MGNPWRRLIGLAHAVLTLFVIFSGAGFAQSPRMVGYLPQWALYYDHPWLARDLVSSGAAPLLDQVNYAQANIRGARCVIADANADLNRVYAAEESIDGKADSPAAPLKGGFHQLQLLKARYLHMQTIISLEGKPSTFAEAALPANRAAFVESCMDMFVAGHLAPGVESPGLFEGFDLDWEFPHDVIEGANYMALVAEFRRQLDAASMAVGATRKPLLSVAAGPGTRRYPGVDWSIIAQSVDEVGLMNYDYSGPWQKLTGMIAPLYPIDGGPPRQGTVDGTVAEYEAAGVPASKLLMGVPFYGYGWQQVSVGSNHGLFQAGQAVHGDSPYNAIAALVPKSTIYRDEISRTPWLFDGHEFWTFDDPVSAWTKAAYAASHHLGGVMIWELSGDTADAQLMRALHAGLRAPATDGALAAFPVANPSRSGSRTMSQ
jgi:chitinase